MAQKAITLKGMDKMFSIAEILVLMKSCMAILISSDQEIVNSILCYLVLYEEKIIKSTQTFIQEKIIVCINNYYINVLLTYKFVGSKD